MRVQTLRRPTRHMCLCRPDVDVGCWEDQPPEAAQSQGLNEPAGRGLQTRREPQHQHPVQDPADGHLRYTGTQAHTHSAMAYNILYSKVVLYNKIV